MSRFSKIAATTVFLILGLFLPSHAQSKVDWNITNAIQLDETPLAFALAPERKLSFLLTDRAKVLIYSEENKLLGTIPVDPGVTGISVSANGDTLYLIDNKHKTLQTVDISYAVDFNTADSPFLGPANARVVIVVFSDFQ
jgi:hypothetical protein